MECIPVLAKREQIAEDILTNKQLACFSYNIAYYDRTRNVNREALNRIKKELKNENKVWVNIGNFFIKMEKESVKNYIEEDQQNLEREISNLRESVKRKTAELEKLETGENKKMKGFDLRGISSDELYKITEKKN
ncbi:18217_t:CDS:2 [Acaulospora morrowiae]|uniref:p53 and DNA damage-regulated protein 1 n=1 Tax=Acaulospora morrowiae TaxID=94023 RepID=A0A9N9I2M9_9GLOM|nr:18217_t:CDS:2 [Acaulospora morrowiae]